MHTEEKRDTRQQHADETVDQYATELKRRAKSCEFEELVEGLLRDWIVCGITSITGYAKKLLRTQDLTSDKATYSCVGPMKPPEAQMKTLTEGQETVGSIVIQKY